MHLIRRLIAAVVVLGLLNGMFLTLSSPPPDAVAQTQYQSLMLSVNTAIHYDQTGELLVVDWGGEDRHRLEDLAADDLGYPLLLSGLTRLGIVDFSKETEAYAAKRWDLADSRVFMRTTLRPDIDWINRAIYAVTATTISLILLGWAFLRSRRTNQADRSLVGLALGIFAVGQVLPHMAPALFVGRLHQHGLIAALGLIGLIAVLALWWTLVRISWRSMSTRSLGIAVFGVLLSGILIGAVALVRRSEGVAWLVTAVVIVLMWVGHRTERKQRIVGILLLIPMVVGWTLPARAVDQIVENRDNNVLEVTGEKAISAHPIYHAFLIGIAQSPKNNLGISNEPDVVALVQAETGFTGTAFSPGYEEVSSQVYWDYVRSSPRNYTAVLLDNVDQKFRETMLHFGLQVNGTSWLLLPIGLALLVLLVVRLAWQIGGPLRIASVILLIHLIASSGIAIATTNAGTFGPAADFAMLMGVGIGSQIYRNTESLQDLARTLAELVRSVTEVLPRFAARVEPGPLR